jgi:hypothetical protein
MANISIPSSTPNARSSGLLAGPLSVLYSGVKPITMYNYPLELGTDATKSHYVQIGVYEVQPATYSATGDLSSPGKSDVNLNLQNIGQGIQNLTTAATNLGQENGAISEGVQTAINKGAALVNKLLSKGFAISPPLSKLKNLISLYMPDSIDARYNAEYTEMELTGQFGKAVNTLRTVDHVVNTMNKVGMSKETTAKALSTDPAVVKAAIDFAGGAFGIGTGLGDLLLQGQGYAINPQLQMIYKGLPLRSFSLSFLFTPKSRQEADIVNNIIHTLKYHSLPSLEQGAKGSIDSMFLVPPSVFDVKFMNKGFENTYLPKYDKCVLESIDVDNTPNGFAAHIDGSPVQTRMTLQFKELYILDKKKLGTDPITAGVR